LTAIAPRLTPASGERRKYGVGNGQVHGLCGWVKVVASGAEASSSSIHTRTSASEGARQSPRGDSEPPVIL